MKLRKVFSVLCAIGIAASNFSAVRAFANDTDQDVSTDIIFDNTDAAGLISYYTLSITADVKKVKISAVTSSTDIQAKIGFVDIIVQHSSNGVTGWTTEKTPADQTIPNSNFHELDKFPVDVDGGYYYRVVLDHYAKEQGWFFPSSQSISNTSNVVWVPAS